MHNKKINSCSKKKIAIIGSGWYGVHIALVLKKECPSYKVTLFEKSPDIFSEISGKFGIRLHSDLYYPRSEATRIACHKGFKGGSLFTAKYEISEKPKDILQNTCELQPYREREIEQVKKAESPRPGFFKSLPGKHFISSHQNLSEKINCYP